MNEINFVDTTLRDGNQSLWGNRLTIGMVLPVASQMDQLGFEAMEPFGFGNFKMLVRQQRVEPWEAIRLFASKVTKTPISMMTGASSGGIGTSVAGIPPLAFILLRFEVYAALGVKRYTVIGNLNDMNFRMPEMVRKAQECGLQVVVGLQFSLSPKHTDEYYAQKAQDAVRLKPDRIYIKDPAGLLTPERARTLIPVVQQNIGGLPLELHSHCTTGLAPLCYLEAIKLGITTLHTGIPPLANGSAQPSVLNVARNARLLGYVPKIDEEAVKPISDHFRFIAQKEGLPQGVPLEYDYAQYLHQVPGGVISNLRRQLAEIRMEQRLEEILEESVQVRKDLGYPIMITPFSQFVVTQATINAMLGERYKVVCDEVVQYVVGYFGEEASSAVDPEVKDKILDSPRGKELSAQEPYEPSVDEFRKKLGGPAISDEEIVLRYMMGGDEELRAMRPAPPIREYPTARTPLVTVIQELLKRTDLHYVRLEKPGLLLTLEKAE